jgi:hypothetical protein
MSRTLRIGIIAGLLAFGAGGIAVPAALASPTAHARKPHIVGTWADDVNLNQNGGYTVWSNGRVQAHAGAPYFGGAQHRGVNNIVGFVADAFSDGYWLVSRSGRVYSFGTTCQFGHLKPPSGVPSRGIVGGIDLSRTVTNEGLILLSSTGKTYRFECSIG